LPNIPEAVVGFLAAASIGAVWAVCGQDYSAESAASRLGQLRPTVLVAADGYRYAGKMHDRRSSLDELRSGLTTLRTTVVVSNVGLGFDDLLGVTPWSSATSGSHSLDSQPVAFEHPLWVLFSSGTTGKPKGIVHSHGGVTLEHLKVLNLHFDVDDSSIMFWYTSPSWMVWNFQLGCLLLGATIVCYDGSPFHPGPDHLWRLTETHRVTHLGVSPAYLRSCEDRSISPRDIADLSRLKLLGVTGSVLAPSSSYWIAEQLGPTVQIAPVSGGTDIVSALAGPVPTLPTWAGELTAPALGVALEAWTPDGHSVTGQVGELVITKPLPSMPVYLWDDQSGSRYRETYFSMFPGTWRHGDWITLTDHGSVIVHGRSDSTLNRNGVRMGSSDIYDVVERIPSVVEALVLGVEEDNGAYWMPLFVVLADGVILDAELRDSISEAIRKGASPKHVPDDIVSVPAIPHTHTGKKLEVPVKRILQGAPMESVVDPGAVDDITALNDIVRIADAIRAASHQPA
jgi:acetoacetyl-CoA synthetase